MREIKFRALYRDKIYPVLEMSFYDDGTYNVTILGYDGGEKIYPDNEHIKAVMQYTGLKDKNGKEIYEGDIVKVENCYQDNFIIEWSSPSFVLFDGKDGVMADEDFGWDDWERMEVIGNIYENPELLKDKNV